VKASLVPFADIYREYFDFVWTAVRRLGVEPGAADDVVQEIFIVIHARVDTVQHPESLRSWVYGVIRRVVSHYHRAQRAKLAATASFEGHPDSLFPRTPFDQGEQTARIRMLREVLEELDAPKREVFMMAELEELTVPEIAEILRIPLNTAYSRLRAARQQFEAAVSTRLGGPEKREVGLVSSRR